MRRLVLDNRRRIRTCIQRMSSYNIHHLVSKQDATCILCGVVMWLLLVTNSLHLRWIKTHTHLEAAVLRAQSPNPHNKACAAVLSPLF